MQLPSDRPGRAHRVRFARLATLAALTWGCSMAAEAQSAAPVADAPASLQTVGTVKTIKGSVKARGAQNTERSLQVGDRLGQDESLSTGDASSVGLTLRDGTLIALGPKTSMKLPEFNYDNRTQAGNMVVSLLQGSMRFVSGLMGKLNHDSVRVITPTATIGIRGTDFIVEEPAP